MPLTDEQKAAARARYAERCKDPAYIERIRLQARERYYRRRVREEADGAARKPVGRPRKYAPFVEPAPYSAASSPLASQSKKDSAAPLT